MKKTVSLVLVLALGLVTQFANADFTWGTPTNLGPAINSPYGEGGVSISADRLEFYFISDRPGGYGGYDQWVMKRPTVEEDWGSPVNLGSPPNSQYSYWEPCISSDGLSLYFSDGHSPQFGNHLPGGLGGQGDIWVITRPTKLDAWSEPENIGPAVNSEHAVHPSISADGLSLYFQSHRPGRLGGHCDIMVATRESTSDTFGAPVFLENVNTTGGDWMPDISADGRTLFFSRGPATEIWMARRTGVQDDFDPPVKLPPQINVPSCTNTSPTFLPDGSTLYFCSDRAGGSGGWDLWQASIEPVVDLNGDGIVDAADMCIIIENWGTDNSLCDIGPMPWGDGIVDVQDLIVIAEHLFEGTGLVAHWALDETEGDIAYDSAGNINAIVYNGQWSTGKIDGALDFNGLTTYMDCGDSPRFGTQKMTLAMWLEPQHMGGMRYVLSRVREGAEDFDYVLMRQYEGQVEFAVTQESSEPVSVMSNATTPLNEWTHVAVCMDGSEAAIYINGQLDASAGYGRRIPCDGCRLWISSLGANTRFYNGKIDDVRIYNIALTAKEIEELAQ